MGQLLVDGVGAAVLNVSRANIQALSCVKAHWQTTGNASSCFHQEFDSHRFVRKLKPSSRRANKNARQQQRNQVGVYPFDVTADAARRISNSDRAHTASRWNAARSLSTPLNV